MCSQYLSTDPKTNFATPTLTPITLKSVYRPHNKVGHFNLGLLLAYLHFPLVNFFSVSYGVIIQKKK